MALQYNFTAQLRLLHVPLVGFEPTRPFEHCILSAARLPFRHRGLQFLTYLELDLNQYRPGYESGVLPLNYLGRRLAAHHQPTKLISCFF